MDQTTKAPTNWYVRTLIALFCLLLVSMIGYRFAWVGPKGEISAGIVTLLSLLLVLVLAESFDSFSVGKLLSISREARKKEREVEKLEKQNAQLLSQLIAVSNSQAQPQSHTNVYGDYHVAPTVRKASEQEVLDKQTTEAPQLAPAEPPRPRMNWRKVEALGLKKYVEQRSLHPSNLIVDAKLGAQFQGIDPIANLQAIFDGYLKEQDHETFVELRPTNLIAPMFRDRLYVLLSRINHYRVARRVDAHLDLVLIRLPGEESRFSQPSDRFLEPFEPAIAGGLLRVMSVDFTEQEVANCREAQ